MTKILRKLTSYRNWIGKTILWIIGLLMVSSQNYPFIMQGFMLTEKQVNIEMSSYFIIVSLGVLFIVSGIYLNKFLDGFINSISNQNKNDTI